MKHFSSIRAALALLTGALLPGVASAATYYVSTSGNDNNNGSAGSPFATIQRAGWAAKPGDEVLVNAGIYYPAQQQGMGYKGDFGGKRVVFRPNGTAKVVFDGSQVQGASYALNTILLGDNVEFRGFEVRNSKSIGIFVWDGGRNTVLVGNDVHDSNGGGVRQDGPAAGVGTGLLITGNRVHDNGVFNRKSNRPGRDNLEGFPPGISFGRGSGIRVTNNEVYRNQGEGILSFGQEGGAVVADNRVYDNFSVNIYLANVKGTTVERNFVYATGYQDSYRFNLPAIGIFVANEEEGGADQASDNVVKNNVTVDCSVGFYFGLLEAGGGLRGTLVANNTFYNSVTTPIQIDNGSHTGSRIANNIFLARPGTELARVNSAAGLTFDHNLWRGGDGNKDAAGGAGDVGGSPQFANAGALTAASYQLASGSPGINAGATIAAVAADFARVARPQGGAYDLGAYELVSGGTTPTPGGPLANGVYTLTSKLSAGGSPARRLDVAGAVDANNRNVQLWEANTSAAQQWRLESTGDGYYKLVAQVGSKTRLLDAASGGRGDRANVSIWAPNATNGGANQRWKIEATGDGYYRLTTKASAAETVKYCLDVNNSANADGTNVQIYTANTSDAQRWKLEPVATAAREAGVAASATPSEAAALSAYPNPSLDGKARLVLAAQQAQRATVLVRDGQGQLVSLLAVPLQAGRTEWPLPSALPAGTYHVQATLDGHAQHFTLKVE